MKKLINDPADVVKEALLGIAAAHPELRVDHANKIIYRGDAPKKGKVGLISGGGSGHEPLHGGFVGLGMLDAACAGEIFTSPVPDQMLEATKHVDGGAGVLHIVKNYTGDVMNFEMAAEMAAAETGLDVDRGRDRRRRRRARQHLDSRTPRRRRHRVAGEDRRRSCRARAEPEGSRRRRAPRQRERAQHGHGAHVVHRARGRQADVRPARRTRWRSASASTASLAGGGCRSHPRRRSPRCWSSRSSPTCRLAGGDSIIAFVNGMGGTPLIELYVMYNEVAKILQGRGVTIARSLVGPYITSLEMAGCSVTLLKVDDPTPAAVGRAGQHAGAAVGNLTMEAWTPSRSTACGPGSASSPA